MCNPSTCDCQYNKAYEIDEYLDYKNYTYRKRQFIKLVLKCEDVILNTNGISLDDKKVTCDKIITLLTQFNW